VKGEILSFKLNSVHTKFCSSCSVISVSHGSLDEISISSHDPTFVFLLALQFLAVSQYLVEVSCSAYHLVGLSPLDFTSNALLSFIPYRLIVSIHNDEHGSQTLACTEV
jgi:hypothetical protein